MALGRERHCGFVVDVACSERILRKSLQHQRRVRGRCVEEVYQQIIIELRLCLWCWLAKERPQDPKAK